MAYVLGALLYGLFTVVFCSKLTSNPNIITPIVIFMTIYGYFHLRNEDEQD
jgi:hypothetical protein